MERKNLKVYSFKVFKSPMSGFLWLPRREQI